VKRIILSIALALFAIFIAPAQATLIKGTFNGYISGGAISEAGGFYIYRPVGTHVSATFSYDTDQLSDADASGNRQDSFFDPSFYFLLLINGSPFTGYANGNSPGADAMSEFWVDATGTPVLGRGTGGLDAYIGPGTISLYLPPFDSLTARINGSFSVPDSTVTLWLLGATCVGLMVARRFTRQTSANR
jgi:hypothetical protein